MGLRGPQSADLGALKLLTVQWAYLLLGLRNGHPDLVELLEWKPWRERNGVKVRYGIAFRITLAHVVSTPGISGSIKFLREKLIVKDQRNSSNEPPQLYAEPLERIQRNKYLPDDFSSNGPLYFPSISPRPDLWQRLKHPRSIKGVKQTVDDLYRWMCDAGEVFKQYRIPEDRIAELYQAPRLWNYPGATDKKRRSSDDKRIEFFAKALAGLILGISPATATKNLSRWKIPPLWKG